MRVVARLGQKSAPVRDHIRPFTVDFEPGDRLWQDGAVEQPALRAGRGLGIEQARLQRENLLQAFDVAPGNWEQAQFDPPLECIG